LIKVPASYDTSAVRIFANFIWTELHPEVQQCSYPHQAMRIRRLKDPAGINWTRGTRLPYHETLVAEGMKACEVVGPVATSKEALLALAPEWFTSGSMPNDLNGVFDKDRTHPNHYDNGFED
jgi:hypothetical protein